MMKTKVFGVPLIAIILILAIVLPSIISDAATRREVKELESSIRQMELVKQVPVVVTPTVTPTVTATPTKAVRSIKSTTPSGELQ